MMNYHVLTLFPEMILDGLNTSIIGRAIENGYISLEAVNIRDFADNKHNKVDDYPYGGGAGMVMQAEPVYQACKFVEKKVEEEGRTVKRVIYVTPQGTVFNQHMAEEFAREEDLVFLCGHYEGIDERVLEEVVTDYVSIGDYVLTGGELPAMVMIDAISRMVPGVLSNAVSGEFESFHDNLLEYPQYSRPEEWRGEPVPPVLLSGNHTYIEEWRLEHSIMRTAERRPDLYEKYKKDQEKAEQESPRKKKVKDVILLMEGDIYLIPYIYEFLSMAKQRGIKVRTVYLDGVSNRLNSYDGLKRAETFVFANSVKGVQEAREHKFRVVYLQEFPEKEPKELVYYRKIGDLVEGMAILRKFS